MMGKRPGNREIDRLIVEHYRALAAAAGLTAAGRAEGRPSGGWRRVAATSGLAAAAAVAIWATAAGIGRSPLAEQSARFVTANGIPRGIARGLEWLHPLVARSFGTGGALP
jgi:ferric-dicitrate binding protein FerR (iron transport regulator)